MKRALITGITGQDGSFLAELLLKKGYSVHGLVRRSNNNNNMRHIQHIEKDIQLHSGDVLDAESISKAVHASKPDEVYNLAALSHVRNSFEVPDYTSNVDGLGCLRVLDAIRNVEGVRFYQASTSELYGMAKPPQSEATPFHPCSPYGIAKMFAFWTTVNYRETYGMFACNGILFNHESERRGELFVTRKIAKGLARISRGLQDKLYLGNLKAKRDFGYAPDFVRAMWMMLQHSEPDDFVIATGESHTVEEFLDVAGEHLGIDWRLHVEIDPQFYRPMEVDYLLGDASKAKNVLGWEPKVKFRELVQIMVDAELEAL